MQRRWQLWPHNDRAELLTNARPIVAHPLTVDRSAVGGTSTYSLIHQNEYPFLSFPAQVRRSSPFIYLQCRVAFAGESLIVLIGFVSSFRLHKIIVRKRVLLNWKICMSCLYVPSSTASQFSPHLPPPLHGASSSFCLIACLVPWFIDFPPMPPRDFCIRLKAPSEFEIPRFTVSI